MNADEKRILAAMARANKISRALDNLVCTCGHHFWIHSRGDMPPDSLHSGCLSVLNAVDRTPAYTQCFCTGFVPVSRQALDSALDGLAYEGTL